MYGRYFVLFAILFTGWFLRKINFIDDKMDHSINKLVVYFAYPCLIVHNIGELDLTADVLADFGLTFVLSLVFFTFTVFSAKATPACGNIRRMFQVSQSLPCPCPTMALWDFRWL